MSLTLKSYEQFFGTIPPRDIWSPPKIRFGRDLHFIRVNTQQHWVISKTDWKAVLDLQPNIKLLPILCVFSLAITSCSAISGLPNPINFTGSEFLIFYVTLGIVGTFFAYWLHDQLRLPRTISDNQQLDNLNSYEIAFLAGGNNIAY